MEIKTGLVKAAKSTKAWLFTSGVNHVRRWKGRDREMGERERDVEATVVDQTPPLRLFWKRERESEREGDIG